MDDEAVVDGEGRLVMPAELRTRLGLREGSRLRITQDGERLVVRPVPEQVAAREVGRLLVIDHPLDGVVPDHREIRSERLDALAGSSR